MFLKLKAHKNWSKYPKSFRKLLTTMFGENLDIPEPADSWIPQYYTNVFKENLYPNLYFKVSTSISVPNSTGTTVRIPRWTSSTAKVNP